MSLEVPVLYILVVLFEKQNLIINFFFFVEKGLYIYKKMDEK